MLVRCLRLFRINLGWEFHFFVVFMFLCVNGNCQCVVQSVEFYVFPRLVGWTLPNSLITGFPSGPIVIE